MKFRAVEEGRLEVGKAITKYPMNANASWAVA